jgi:hypothetical protein
MVGGISTYIFAIGNKMFSLRDNVWRWRPRTAKRLLATVITDIIPYFSYAPNETQDCRGVFKSLVKSIHQLIIYILLGSLRLSKRLSASLLLSLLPTRIVLLLLGLSLTGVRFSLVRLLNLLLLRISEFIFHCFVNRHPFLL